MKYHFPSSIAEITPGTKVCIPEAGFRIGIVTRVDARTAKVFYDLKRADGSSQKCQDYASQFAIVDDEK